MHLEIIKDGDILRPRAYTVTKMNTMQYNPQAGRTVMGHVLNTCPTRRNAGGFTLIELIVVIIVVGVVASMAYMSPRNEVPTNTAKDIDVIKSALRHLEIRTMADLPNTNWYASGTASEVVLYNNGTRIIGYALSGTTGAFKAAFNQAGQLQTNQSIPNAIYIEPETGYIP